MAQPLSMVMARHDSSRRSDNGVQPTFDEGQAT